MLDLADKIFGIVGSTIAFFLIVNCIEIVKHNIKHNKEIKHKKIENDRRNKQST